MLQHIRESFKRSAIKSLAKAQPGYDSFYQFYRMPSYAMVSVFGEIDGRHDKVLRR